MSKQKHLSGQELVKQAQESNAKNFKEAYWEVCRKFKLQIVQTPLSLMEFKEPESITQTNEETKP